MSEREARRASKETENENWTKNKTREEKRSTHEMKNVHVAFRFAEFMGISSAASTHTEGREVVLWPNGKSGAQQSEE